jgi:hypothetical protein
VETEIYRTAARLCDERLKKECVHGWRGAVATMVSEMHRVPYKHMIGYHLEQRPDVLRITTG